MGMIRIYEKAGKTKKKPGWQQREAEYKAWLASVQSMSSGIRASKPIKVVKPAGPKPDILRNSTEGISPVSKYVVGSGTKPVHRPEIVYKDDPEMLERELAARQRRFNVAPAYNKGGDVFVTEEHLMTQLAGNKRRS